MSKRPDRRAEMCQEYYDVLIAALRFAAYRYGYATGDWVVDVVFDHRPQKISHGHFTTFIKREPR